MRPTSSIKQREFVTFKYTGRICNSGYGLSLDFLCTSGNFITLPAVQLTASGEL